MALLLNCKQGVVRVNGEPVTGIVILPEDAVIEPMTEARFELLMAQTVAETIPDAGSGVPSIRADFPPNVFLAEIQDRKREEHRWLLQTPDGAVRFAYSAGTLPVITAA